MSGRRTWGTPVSSRTHGLTFQRWTSCLRFATNLIFRSAAENKHCGDQFLVNATGTDCSGESIPPLQLSSRMPCSDETKTTCNTKPTPHITLYKRVFTVEHDAIILWGCFSTKVTGRHVRADGKWNEEKFKAILRESLFSIEPWVQMFTQTGNQSYCLDLDQTQSCVEMVQSLDLESAQILGKAWSYMVSIMADRGLRRFVNKNVQSRLNKNINIKTCSCNRT